MQPTPYLRPTVLQRLRTFLGGHVHVPAWSAPDEVLDQLHDVLVAHRDDGAFWTQLEEVVHDLQDDVRRGRAHGLPAREAEIFSEAQITTIVAELRGALRGSGSKDARGTMARVLIGRSAAAAACITLLGAALSIGCAKSGPGEPARGSDSSTSALDPRGASPATPGDAGADSLAALFRDGSPDDVAAKLESMIDAAADDSAAEAAAPRTVPTSRPPPKSVPNISTPVPLYKGVTV